jgi:UDP-GlcNAc:undecaprenyl-phosphate/decaprenyl-phosphate GlcNAc-1-phosphate transferase
VFAVGAGVSFLATPLVRRLAIRARFIDHPSDRKVHPRATPTAGGLAIFIGVASAIGASRLVPSLAELHATTSEVDAALLAGAVIVAVGGLDDVRGISVIGKLAGQVLAAGLLVLFGVQLLYFYFPGQGTLVLGSDLAVPLTVIWIVAMVNAVNLIDGLDGLAAGMVAIGALAFFAYMFRSPGEANGPSTAALLSAIVAGSAIGFLPWNFHPAKIFMGDSGAMLLGLLMAVATISGVGHNLDPPTGGDLAAIAIPVGLPLLVLAIPFLDVLLAIARRMRRRVSVTHADKEHIHHRLLDIGHTHRQAVLLMYLWSALISGSALAVAFIDGRFQVAVILVAAVFLATVLPMLVRRSVRAREARDAREAEPAAQSRATSAGSPERAPAAVREHTA